MNGNSDEVSIEWKQFGEAFVADLWQFFNSDEYSDVTIITEDGHEVKSHRILLAMCSTYFREIFRRNKGSGHIVCLSHMRSDIVLKIFGLIYGGVTQVKRRDLDAFLKAAKYLKLHGFDEINSEENGRDTQRLMNRSRSFSLTLQRMDASDVVRNITANGNNRMTPAMNSLVSSTHEPPTNGVINGTTHEAATEQHEAAIEQESSAKDDKFFPSDDSDDSISND